MTTESQALATCVPDLWDIMSRGWPGLTTQRLGDWLLRYGGGYTGRANSALALGDPGLPLAFAVDEVARRYAAAGLPAMLHLAYPLAGPDGDVAALDAHVATRGWQLRTPTYAMVRATTSPDRAQRPEPPADGPEPVFEFADLPDDAWIAHLRGGGDTPAALVRAVVTAGSNRFLHIRVGDSLVGRARLALVDSWCGITDLHLDPAYRARGWGRHALHLLLAQGAARGATMAYLQVLRDNDAAIRLYQGTGWQRHSAYHYRVAPPQPAPAQ